MLAVFCIVLGVIAFLVIEHPIAFWCLFVPLIIMFLITVVNLLTGRRGHIGNLLTIFCVFLAIIVALVIVATPDKCEHEDMVTMYSFTSHNSTAHSNVRDYCRGCDTRYQAYLFQGTPKDQSYLSAISENSYGGEIVPGEYYTVTATVPLGFVGYTSDNVWLNCRVENEEFIVGFTVEFREEFKEAVRLVENGDKITFRGRFYDEGCGFTDCKLIRK